MVRGWRIGGGQSGGEGGEQVGQRVVERFDVVALDEMDVVKERVEGDPVGFY